MRSRPGMPRRWTSSRKAESFSRGKRAPLNSRRRFSFIDGVLLERLARLVGLAPVRAGMQAHVAARIGGTAEADLVPRPRMRVERRERAARDDRPGARDVDALPGAVRQL